MRERSTLEITKQVLSFPSSELFVLTLTINDLREHSFSSRGKGLGQGQDFEKRDNLESILRE